MAKRKEDNFCSPENAKRSRQEEVEDSDKDGDEDECTVSFTNGTSTLTAAEVGIIESIQLKNFMCHSMLGPFKFGSNVNFVVGNNGSGKSAVLTALIVGLGGKAIATNRGSSLKGFVKDGQNSADISITLRNRGDDAYRANVYGNSIVVQQHISMDGSRSYKLKSEAGAVVSTRKEELIAILDHFNIQVDNPVSVLTQEMSKQFLQSKNEGDKYKFFMKATQLEQMKEDYSYIMETKERTKEQISQGEEVCKNLMQRLTELKRQCLEKEERFEIIAGLSTMKTNLEHLKHEMAWAVVNEIEKQLNAIRDNIKIGEDRAARLERKMEEQQVRLNEAENKYKDIQDKLEKISQETNARAPECMALKADVTAKKRDYNDAEVLYNRSLNEYRALKKDDEQLCKRIEELKKSADQSLEPERLERQKKISWLKDRVKTLQDQESSVNQEIEQFQQAIEKDKEEHTRIRREELDVKQALNINQRHLKELKDSKTDRLKRFGPHVPALLEAIDDAYRRGQFTYKPVGPLGACIHLRDPELALAIESCLKGLLQAYCCHNHSDERVLQALMRKFYLPGTSRPQIIVSEFRNEMYDVRHRAAYHPEFPTVLTALEIDNAVVANSLIDMRGIETVLLIKNNSVARAVMQSQKPPKNCREAFTADGDQVFAGRYYSSEYTRPKFLSRDVDSEISELENDVENKKAQILNLQQHLSALEKDIKRNEEFLRRYQLRYKELKLKIRKSISEIQELENMEEHQSVDIATLEDEAQENKSKMKVVEKNMEQQKENMERLKSLKVEAENKYDAIKLKVNQLSELADPLKDELNLADSEVDNQKRGKRHYEEKQKEHLDTLNKKKRELDVKEKELEEKMSQARQICPERIEVKKSASILDKEINRLRQKIQAEHASHGDREEIMRQYQEARETYLDLDTKVKTLKRFIKLLEEIMTHRYKTYQQFRRCLTLRCKLYFDNLLSQRAYCGKMNFDHKNETLTISVQPGEGNRAAFSDMRALSGGERSFSTVCFILSLWSIAESPFRCLDEFDVYMDMVNRRIAMDMILKMADSQRFRQFILLTPQSMSSLPSSKLIRILRMSDPERGQMTLPFRPVNQEEEEN
ncbi:structural maintenance of chromosomes protein 6 isoform X1 [Molossus molossus]|uniref:structural maintenance of chromosomes protein 6 isoform X1 n=2 Tax=Molossus molossus TaxID=27622 RepID=UPI0017472C7C|nr:structural maintenance of chromosomes protein 6 isoform X1 [Molossus molossus]XP_036118640.1 structural maintenance of chromosomes protein 6 isoform X1 [Molossus molossus]